MVSVGDVVALQRSAAMVQPGQSVPVPRDTLIGLCDELLELRALVTRVGTGVRDVAQRSRTINP